METGSESSFALNATRTPWPTFTPITAPTPTPVADTAEPAGGTAAPVADTPAPVAGTAAPVTATVELVASPSPPPAAPTGAPDSIPTATPTLAPPPTSAPATGIVPAVEPAGWSLTGLRISGDEYEEGLVVYGELINDTGSAQTLVLITATFYDAQGQVIANPDSVYDYWPVVDAMPPGGRIPFGLVVDGIREAANFTLSVQAEPADASPRQDLQISNLSQLSEEDLYCVQGTVQGPAETLQSYLVIVAVLYDAQNTVINFGDYYEPYLEAGQTLDFEICMGPPNQGVARYEVRAWGL